MPTIKQLLLDIEGTTTPIDFVHRTLFTYASEHISSFVKIFCDEEHVKSCLLEADATAKEEHGVNLDQEGVIHLFKTWIAEDRKHPALKRLQGYIWKKGYLAGELKSELYPDVKPCLEAWHKKGLGLAIYSSGSVEAQKLLFGYSDDGDLNHLFNHYFDTQVGPKREVDSYGAIASQLKLPASDILFLSDVVEELDAAKAVGMQTCQLVRPGTTAGAGHPHCRDFVEVEKSFLQ